MKEGQTVWVENPEHGTIKGTVLLAGGTSFLIQLEAHVALHARGGLAITDVLALTEFKGIHRDIVSWAPWAIYFEEPAIKIPTK